MMLLLYTRTRTSRPYVRRQILAGMNGPLRSSFERHDLPLLPLCWCVCVSEFASGLRVCVRIHSRQPFSRIWWDFKSYEGRFWGTVLQRDEYKSAGSRLEVWRSYMWRTNVAVQARLLVCRGSNVECRCGCDC